MAGNDESYQPWPHSGKSFDVASTVVALLCTNFVALFARLYMVSRRQHPLLAIRTISICAAHVSLDDQSVELTD